MSFSTGPEIAWGLEAHLLVEKAHVEQAHIEPISLENAGKLRWPFEWGVLTEELRWSRGGGRVLTLTRCCRRECSEWRLQRRGRVWDFTTAATRRGDLRVCDVVEETVKGGGGAA